MYHKIFWFSLNALKSYSYLIDDTIYEQLNIYETLIFPLINEVQFCSFPYMPLGVHIKVT
jgi:hypothetical protein